MLQDGGIEMDLIDFHVHTFPDGIARRTVELLSRRSGLTPATDGTVGDTLQKLAQWGISLGVLFGIATKPSQQRSINDFAAKTMRENAGRCVCFGTVHWAAPDALDEIERIRELGLPGIKLHPDYQDFLIDDPKMFPVYDRCAALGLPVLFHTGYDPVSPELMHAPPERSRRAALAFPKMTFVLAHMGSNGYWQNDVVERELCGLPNVWFDTSLASNTLPRDHAERIIRKHGADRVLCASDCPWSNPMDAFRYLEGMKLSDGEKENIYARNARRLLGL